jgi:type III secretion system YscQ/HrcQ family protein
MSGTDPAGPGVAPGAGPLADLPRLDGRAVRLARALGAPATAARVRAALGWLAGPLGAALEVGPPEVLARASGLARPGAIAQMAWPGRGTRLALGLETTLAHALVDRLLGHDRRPGEDRLQVTPVEWGILTYVVARCLATFLGDAHPDLVLDRVGPEPFDPSGLGVLATARWPLRVGDATGSLRLWIPEGLLHDDALAVAPADPPPITAPLRALAAWWHAEAGAIALPRGLGRLRAGVVLPIDGAPLGGTPASPAGPVALVQRGRGAHGIIPGAAVPLSGGGRFVASGPFATVPTPREAFRVDSPQAPPAVPAAGATPADVPVTLVVELGRVSLPVAQVAALKAGDVVELSRHAREPVELTSNGRLVARGELVLIENELGVRVTTVFL